MLDAGSGKFLSSMENLEIDVQPSPEPSATDIGQTSSLGIFKTSARERETRPRDPVNFPTSHRESNITE